MKKYGLIIVALGLALLLGLALWLRGEGRDQSTQVPAGADFLLQSANGPVDSKALRGQVLLVYFGYTHCPDICPASLASGGQALKALSDAERSKVRLIMISVDPERDSLARLKEYTAFFHPEMIGATGTVEQIATLAKSFGAGYIRQPSAADGSYAVDHTTSTYVLGPNGKLAAVLEHGASTDKVVSAIRKLL